MKKLLFIFLLFLTISCTTTRYIEVEKEIPIVENKTEYRDKLVYDSIYMRDSIYIISKDDTVYIYKEKNNIRYIYKTDTLIKIDSIPYPVRIKETETKDVYKFKLWQLVLMSISSIIFYLGMDKLKNKLKL